MTEPGGPAEPYRPAEPVRFGVVGTGWRTGFFVRLARLRPDVLSLTGVVASGPERAAEVGAAWGLPAHLSVEELLDAGDPEFVITSLPWPVNPGVVEELAGRGVPVLSETPPAPDGSGLRRLWERVGGSGRVQVAEQYPLMPMHAARLAAVRAGWIGTPTSVQISSTHGYHAMALIRAYLGAGPAPATIHGSAFTAPLLDPMDKAGWRPDPQAGPVRTTIATVDLGDLGMGLYDFTDNQWHNRLRGRRLVVRGSHGEIADTSLTRWAGPERILTSPILRRQSGYDLDLEGYDTEWIVLDGQELWRNPFPGLRLADEDVAILSLLVATAAWARGAGPAPYPLAEACHDHALALAIDESIAAGRTVTLTPGPWAGAG
jgi:predicted dehydrogenase